MSGAGAPLLANYQTAVFYPPNWLTPAAARSAGDVLDRACCMSSGPGSGCGCLPARWDLPTFGRGISTLSYALSRLPDRAAGIVPHGGSRRVDSLAVLAGAPRRHSDRAQPRDVGWLALVFGMQLLAGHAQTTLYSSFGVGLYVLWRAVHGQRRDRALRVFGIVLAGVGVALGAAVAAVQLIPTAEYLLESQRSGGLDYETLTNLSYHPLRLFTLFSPNFFGTPADGSYLAKGIYFEDAAYIGFIPLISALAAVVGWFRKRRMPDEHPTFATVPFWALLALVALFIRNGQAYPAFPPALRLRADL